jgi:DNA polymerase-3 subunit epsilon
MFAIIDVESTGGDPKRDRMMEIAILIHNGKRVIEEFATLINPEVLIQNL